MADKQRTLDELTHPTVAREILRHGALRVRGVIRRARRLRAVAVATEVGRDDPEPRRERPRHPVPHRVRLRVAVQEEQGRTAPAHARADPGAARLDVVHREAGEEVGHRGRHR